MIRNLDWKDVPVSGETDLSTLLASMEPQLHDPVYDFVTLDGSKSLPAGISALMMFREAEGTTLILEQEEAARAGFPPSFPCRMITLNIHSSLQAIGFLAAIVPRLAEARMGVNPVAGFYHDHLFVPEDRAEDALEILRSIARQHALIKPE